MRTATDAYKSVAKEIASPRDLEATLLLKAAARLQAVSDSWDRDRSDLPEALTYNRKLWTVFLGDVASPTNQLPIEIRQNIANLGVFIMNQTLSVTSNPRREALKSLININRELAAGLRAKAPASNPVPA
jgi:flagellar biosynthesis activator protein FlaF